MKVELNDESLEKGTELHINELGTLVNGKAVEFDDEALERFENFSGKTVAEAFKDDERITLTGAGSRTTSDDKKDETPKKDGGDS